MTKEQRLINIQKQFANPTYKTYEQFILEEKSSLVSQQDLHPEIGYEDISEQKGYGPCKWDNPNCSCSTAQLERQAAELKVQREREALEHERKQREREEAKRKEAEKKEAERKRKETEEKQKSEQQKPYKWVWDD